MRKKINGLVTLQCKIDGKELPVTKEKEATPVFKVFDKVRVVGYMNTANSNLGWPSNQVGYDSLISQVHNWHGTIGYRLEETDYWYVAEDLELVS